MTTNEYMKAYRIDYWFTKQYNIESSNDFTIK